jgi:thioredoxin-related protein
MNRRNLILALSALAALPASGAGEAPDLPLARDLRADAVEIRERRIPLVILFSLPGCPYCSEVRRSHLLPMLRDPAWDRRAVLRQVNLRSDAGIIGFDGASITHEALARAHGVRAAPVVAFWDSGGKPIAESLSGMLLPDFYGAYLAIALEAARARLTAPG